MERIISIDSVETTADCVAALNEKIKESKWKRKVKFNIKTNQEDSSVVRVFSDGTDTVSIVQSEYGAEIVNFDLGSIRPLIEQIQKTAKTIFTFDYGEIYLNPWEKKVWVVGGDGGIVQTSKKPSRVAEMMMEGVPFPESWFNIDFGTPDIKETIVEAEHFPPLSEDEDSSELGWIQVARAVDLSDLMY